MANEAYVANYVERHPDAAFRTSPAIIPVVVHIVYNTAAQNLPDSAVHNQIAALNRDFGRSNADVSTAPPVYGSLAADAQIRFQLAVRDPACNATTGITRRQTTVTAFDIFGSDAMKSNATGGTDPWPAAKYLNIWVCPALSGQGGRATFPGTAASVDGVIVNYQVFGPGGGAYTLGRVGVHEVGHYFQLYHPFDSGCAGDDAVADTPSHAAPNYGCPTFPRVSCSGVANGDMFMQYMDYTNDACKVMFTAGQAARMQAALTGPRSSLLASDGLVPPPASTAGDLWSADTPSDTGAEPNTDPAPMWLSEDIWVRNQNDGVAVQDHENPVYRPSGPSSYVYVRVRNRGCSASGSGTVRAYWAKASTALSWPQPWDGSVIAPGAPGHPVTSSSSGSVGAGGTASHTLSATATGPISATLDWSTATAAIPASPHFAPALGNGDVPFTVSANGTISLSISWPAATPNPIVFLSLLDADAGNTVVASSSSPTGNTQSLSYTVSGLAAGASRNFVARAQNNSPGTVSYTHASSYPITPNLRLELLNPSSVVVASDVTTNRPKSLSYTVSAGGTGTHTVRVSSVDWPASYTLATTHQEAARMGGVIGSQAIGPVPGGGSVVVAFPWTPPNPDDYSSFGGERNHFCLLSRIETSPTAPYGMTTPETSDLAANVRNNNNIVWKNVSVVTVVRGGGAPMGFVTVGKLETDRDPYIVVELPDLVKAQERRPEIHFVVDQRSHKRLREVLEQSEGLEFAEEGKLIVRELGQPLGPFKMDPGEQLTLGVLLSVPAKGAADGVGTYRVDLTMIERAGGDDRIVGGQRLVYKVLPEPPRIEIGRLLGRWWHLHEEDKTAFRTFRREGFEFPVSLGRWGFQLNPDHTAAVFDIAAADGVEEVPASWFSHDGKTIHLSFANPDRQDEVLDLEAVDDQTVLVREPSKQTRREGAASEERRPRKP